MAIFEALIGGATTLLGGLFGKKKQKTETTIDYVKMAKEAQKAGFNPLTALRNGGSAGFTSTVSHPGLSGVAEAVGQIGGSLGAALDQRMDPIEQKRDQVESALLDYQLKAIQSGPKRPMMFGDVPTRKAQAFARSAPALSQSPVVRPRQGPNLPGVGTMVGGDDPTVSSMGWNDGKYGYFEAPFMPDAEVSETIHGDNELMSMIYSAGKVMGNAGYSLWRNGKSAYGDVAAHYDRLGKTKPDPKYAREYRRNIRESVPSLAKPPVTTW